MTAMSDTTEQTTGSHGRQGTGTVRAALEALIRPAAFVPEWTADPTAARTVLRRDGAVVVTGYEPTPDGAVRAAADLLGAKLHRINSLRPAHRAEKLVLHTDGWSSHHRYRIGEREARTYREDFTFLLGVRPADHGGESIVADGYRLLDLLGGDPSTEALPAFMASVDLDPGALSRGGDPAASQQVLRLVEFTRSGRRVVTAPPGVGFIPFDPSEDDHQPMLDLWADVVASLTAVAPRCRLGTGEVLCVDNYRSLHGRDGFDGDRTLQVLRCESLDAM